MLRGFLILITALGFSVFATFAWAAGTIRTIEVEGNRRVETPTIMTYIDVKVGESISLALILSLPSFA